MNTGINIKTDGRIISRLFRNSVISIIAAAIATMLGIVIDGVIIGRFLGTDSMAAYGLVTPVINLTTVFSGILATGAQINCAQHLGAGHKTKARHSFSTCMVLTIAISVVVMAIFLIFRFPISRLLGAQGKSAHLLKPTADYLLGVVFSFPSVLFLFEFNALMRLDGDANRVIFAVVTMTVLDVIGDLVNALVIHGGMLGMGLTTSISYFAALVIMLLHFTKKDIIFRFSFKGIRLRHAIDIFTTGSSSAVGSASAMLRSMVLNLIMVATVFSSTAVAALGVVNTVINFTSSTMMGVGMTTAMIAGVILGERDRNAAEMLVRVTIRMALLVSTILTVLLMVFAEYIAGAFGSSDGAEMVALATKGLRFYALSTILYGWNVAFINYMQGMKRMVIADIFCFLQNFVYVVIPAMILFHVFNLDIMAVWLSFVICESLVLATIYIIAAVKKRGLPCHAKDFLFLKEPFGVDEKNMLNLSIADEESIAAAGEAVTAFCQRKNAGEEQSALMGQFVDELCRHIMRFGFGDSKKHSIDIRVMLHNGKWSLRVRDNCKKFDVIEWVKLHEDEDETKHTAIRTVCRQAKNVKYLSTMDLNNITVTL